MPHNQSLLYSDRPGRDLKVSRRRFQTLARALARLNATRKLEDIIAIAHAEAALLAATDGVCLITPDAARARPPTAGWPPQPLPLRRCLPAFVALACESIGSGETAFIDNACNAPRLSTPPPEFCSMVAVPLGGPARPAAMVAYWQQPRRHDAEELAVLESLMRSAWDALRRRQTEERLRQSEARLGGIFTHASVGLCELSLQGRFLRVNDELCRLLDRSREELLELTVPDVTHPEDVQHSLDALQRLIASGEPGSLDKRYLRPDGSWVWATSSLTRLDDERGRPIRLLAVTVDLTRRKRAEDALRASERRYRVLADLSPDGILVSRDGICLYANRAALRLLGADSEGELIGRPTLEFVSADCRSLARKALGGLCRDSPTSALVEQRWRRRNGTEIDLEVTAGLIEWEGAAAVQILLRDITERKRAGVRIWRHANFDALTRLPNRRLFRDRLDQEVEKARRFGHQLGLLFIDLDGFKEVNDLLGHDAGDQLLVQAAQRLQASVRRGDTVARVGGDEFTVILAELEHAASAEQVAQKLVDALAKPFTLGADIAYVSGSVGITRYPGDATSAADLIRTADQAMYLAKHAGKNRFAYFTKELDRRAHQRLRLLKELRTALSEDQFEVHYQPVMNLASERIAKAEALLRWRHPRLGLVMPSEFIPLAEESGLIREIDDWVFRAAARYVKDCQRRFEQPLQVTINKSPNQFLSVAAENELLRFLQRLELGGESVTIEITEGVLLEASRTVTDRLLKYRDAGIQVAIDDFGTGYSSLAYLKKFDIDYLKIDQSFVRDMTRNRTNRTIAETIIVMAHQLELQVIAEGIEDEDQLALLRAAGCDFGQGFLFAKPLPAAGFDRLLAAQA